MKNGMTKATEFVLSGGSAGGLSTFLHADRVADRLKKEAPGCSKIRAAPIVGYFLDHDNFAHSTGFPGGPNTPQWAKPGTAANYTSWMKVSPFQPSICHYQVRRLPAAASFAFSCSSASFTAAVAPTSSTCMACKISASVRTVDSLRRAKPSTRPSRGSALCRHTCKIRFRRHSLW